MRAKTEKPMWMFTLASHSRSFPGGWEEGERRDVWKDGLVAGRALKDSSHIFKVMSDFL